MPKFKIAGVQMDIRFADIEANLESMKEKLVQTCAAGAWLTVFPECTTTGYCFGTLEQAKKVAEPITGSTVSRVVELAAEHDTRIVFGFLESEGDVVFNSLALVDASGVRGCYRKVHLPTLGVDRFTTAGTEFPVVELDEMNIGLNICYDLSLIHI